MVDFQIAVINNAQEFINNFVNNKTPLSIFHCNICSVYNNFYEICAFLIKFNEKQFHSDVIIFTETWYIRDNKIKLVMAIRYYTTKDNLIRMIVFIWKNWKT